MRASLRSPWAWLPPAVALALVAGILGTDTNRALFLWLNRGGEAVGDLVWFHLTMLGDGAVALALVLPWIRRAPHLFWAALLAQSLVFVLYFSLNISYLWYNLIGCAACIILALSLQQVSPPDNKAATA